jgi:hypothetical protein
MASILDEIKAEVEAELSQQPQEEKPASVLEDVKQEVSAEPQQTPVEEPKADFFESAERWLEPAPTQKSSGDIFLGLISNKRSNELDDEEKGLFNALSDEEQYKVAQSRKDIPLNDAQARRIFEVEKSKMPSIPTSWEDWYNLGGDAWDVVKNVSKLGAKVGLGAAEFGRDVVKATDMTVSDEEAANNIKKAKGSFYSFMAPAFEIPESVAWATAKAQEGGFGWADAAGEKLGLVNPEDRFERWKGRRLVSQAQAEYFREHPTVYSRMLDNPLAKDALSYIAKSQMESPEELAVRDNISVEEAKAQQDAMAREQIDNLTSDMESELPEENARVRIAGEFLLPGELGMGTMGAVSAVAKAGTGIAKGLKYIGKSADEIAEINKAAQTLRKSEFAEMLRKRTERAEAVAQGAGKIEKAIERFKPAAEKVNKVLGNITAPVLGGVAGYSVYEESPMTGILSGVLGGVAARGVLKGTKVGLEIPTFVREVAEARKVAPLGKTFETLGKSAEGSALKAKILSRGGKTIDNILSNSVEYAKTGIHGTTLALATGALESADPEEMKQMLADGLAITLGGRALQHIKGKMMGNDPIIEQRERISDDSRIHRRYQEADPETQANLDQISDFDNAISARETKLNESESDLANLMAAYKGSAEDARKIKLAQSEVEKNKIALDQVKRANVQTRNEFGREFLKTYANLQDITNGVMKSGQNNVGFNVLSTDQIYQKLRNDPANSNVPDADLAQMASQAGFYSNPAQQGLAFDRRKPSIVINADSIRERIKLFGESPTEALVHETSHFMDVVPEFQEALAPVRSMLFQNEIRDAAGNIKATTSGIFSKAKLVELFNDGYLRHLDPQGREAFSKLNKLWDESRGQLDENKVANYMKSEVMADLLGEVSSRHLANDLDSATLAMWDRARIKAKKNLLDRAINRFYGLGGRGDIVTAANTRAEFPPEAMAAARDAMRQIVSLNGEISPPAQEADMPAISKAQMMKNSALIERFGKDSPLFKTEFKVKVFDKDGNQVGESMPVTTPNPREGTFQSTDVGMKKLSGYGDIPAEAQGLQVPEGGTLVVSRDLVMEPDGVTPVMYDAKDAKKIDADRKKLITEALDTDDYGTPNRFEPVAEGSETYRGTFTPAQIQAIKDMPESLVPRTLKEHMLKVNDAIARGDGTRFIVDYAAVMNDKGKYQAFSPKMYDLVPIGMHLSKKGNFLVTTISVGRIFDKMRLWNERMPGRLRFWDNNLERTFDDFSKYLNNWQQGKAGETGLDADPQVALQKKNIFNDLLNLYDKGTEFTNLDRTTIPRKKGDPRNKDANRTIMSIRVDHIAELIPNENATKLPVNYGFAKINFMPERMEGEVPTQEPTIGEKTEIYPKIGRPTISEKPKSSEMIGADTIKPADLQTSAKPEADSVIKPFSNVLVSSAGLINFLPAYHGTPFEVDKFKLANIGTGEGAQAYGWGLYFAQARKVAEEYARVLANRDLTGYKNAQLNAKDIVSRLGGNAEYAAEILRDQLQSIPENSLNFTRISDTLKMIETGEYAKDLEAQGNLYKVDIDVKDEDLLDWDKPLSEQPESVRDAITAIINERIPKEIADSAIENMEAKGGSLYALISDSFGESAQGTPEKRASEALLEAGIPGIRYLDQQSRATTGGNILGVWQGEQRMMEDKGRGKWFARVQVKDRSVAFQNAPTSVSTTSMPFNTREEAQAWAEKKISEGTYNYVVFDENLITILDKNDKPVAGELPTKQPLGGIQFMPQRPVGKTQAGYDYTYLDQAMARGKDGRVALTRPVRADEALPLLSQRIPITEQVDKDSFDYTRPAEVVFYQHENKPVSFKYDPELIEKPVFKDIATEHAGKNVQLAMADRQTATGGDMGGIIFPWLKSNANAIIIGDDGIKYRAVWGNNEWKPVFSMKNKNINFNASNLLTYLMGEDAHASNTREVRVISNEIENSKISRNQKDLFLILANIGVKKQKRADQQKNIKSANDSIEEAKKLTQESTDKEEIKKLKDLIKSKEKDIEIAQSKFDKFIETSDEELIKQVITKYKTSYTRFKGGTGSENNFIKNQKALNEFKQTKSFKNLLKLVKNKQLISLDDTFKGRKASIAQILGLTIDDFNVDNILNETMDFKNGRINQIVGSVELSRNPDLMAVYLGDDPNQAKRMTAQEARAAAQLKSNPNFVPHEAYSWAMLGPVDGNYFLNSNPKTHLEYFPDFKEAYANIQDDADKKKKILEGNETTLMGAIRDNTQMPLAMPAISAKK